MATFRDLGIDFPLFRADVAYAARWEPEGRCVICDREEAGFEIGIGDYVDARCSNCGELTPVPADDRAEECCHCDHSMALGRNFLGDHGCWTCLKAGRWSSTKDTEAGMVTPVYAARGRTHGLPFPPGALADAAWSDVAGPEPRLAGWPVTDRDESGWRAAIIPTEVLISIVRMPGYETWQGDHWLFHCENAMAYVGEWAKEDFVRVAGDDAQAVAEQACGLQPELWDHLGTSVAESAIKVYMFECLACGSVRGHFDFD